MSRIVSICAIGILFLCTIAVGGDDYRWNDEFKIQVIQATLRLIPDELQRRLPASEEAIVQAVVYLKEFQEKKRPDLEKQIQKVKEYLKNTDTEPSRLLAELTALTAYYLDATAPHAAFISSPEFRGSRAYAKAKFDGYHQYPAFASLPAQIETVIDPTGLAWTEETDRGKLADRATDAFNLYVNVTADVWTALALDAGLELHSGREVGLEVLPPAGAADGDAFRPAEEMGFGFSCDVLLVQLREAENCRDLDISAASETAETESSDGEEFVFDEEEGVAVSEQEAQEVGHAVAEIDTTGIDRSSELDAEALAALNKLGIDMSQSKYEFKGIRGGIKPGETLQVGDVSYQIENLSSVEIDTRSERKVVMQMAGEAMGGTESTGRMEQKIVATVIGANVGGFKSCFERRLRVVPDLSGRVFLEFVIGADGLVSFARILENTTDDVDFAECLLRQMKRLRFPPPENGEVTFVFPFIFEQAMNL